MDSKLAEIYGTNQASGEDLEKLAAAELAEGLAGDEELDFSEMDPEQIEALAREVLSADGEEVEEPEGEEKVAEADYLGRVMAHAYVQELRGIDKEAGFGDKAKSVAGKAWKGLKRVAKGEEAREGAKGYRRMRHAEYSAGRGNEKAQKVVSNIHAMHESGGGWRGQKRHYLKKALKGGAKTTALYGAAPAAGGAAYAAHKRKAASATPALDELAQRRAEEILAQLETEEKTSAAADPYDVLAMTVEDRALQMLADAGYEIDSGSEE